ncbi:MAG TPA: large-conductance mechanosensitive channel protein MscL [Candidatus Paceibacterota bacterium]|nr:large-conductance mechanosensitive channel protein MscL [Candidatus Paceibacterota bacterium]
MNSFLKEFKTFALRGNALDLAVGVVIGAAFNGIVTSLVNNVLTPPLGMLIGGVNFSDLVLPIGGEASIQYGVFIQALISFIITAFALFLLVSFINKFLRKADKEPKAPAPKSEELVVLEEIRDALKQK